MMKRLVAPDATQCCLVFIFAIGLLTAWPARAQEAVVEGRVVEAATGEPLLGVNVVVLQEDGFRRGASTDEQGRFRIEALPEGAYTLRATSIGYVPLEQRVQLADGETVSLVIDLDAKAYELSEIVVRGRQPGETVPTTVHRLSAAAIARQDPATVPDVAQLVPGAHVHTNSRGQTILYFRNSSDRQTAQFFEGALLNVPWDNRVDLGMLPAAMLEGVTASTGVPSVRYGANVTAGAVNFHPRALDRPGHLTEVTAALGTPKVGRASVVHLGRKGDFSYTAALDYAGRGDVALADNSFPLADSIFSQPSGETRVNTDRWLASGFLRGAYQFDSGARLAVSVFHVDAEHGIAPESHLNPALTGVRYWRYPTWRKSMLIVSGATLLGAGLGEGARLRGAVWFNRFEQTINQYGSVAYEQVHKSRQSVDYTGGVRLIGEVPAGPGALALSANALTTQHWQNILHYESGAPGPDSVNVYRQHIVSLGAEYDLALTDRLEVSAGASLDGSLMADTGPFPERDPFWAWGLTSGFTYDLSDPFLLRASAGRKARFPTMRELFGAALGKFVVNPELQPIAARMAEVGIEREGRRFSGGVTAFLQKTDGTISQRTIQSGPNAGKEQRINLGGSRTYGLEVVAAAAPTDRLAFDGQLTWMNTRAVFEGETTKRNEKPSWLGMLTATYELPMGIEALAQVGYLAGAYARTEQNTFVTLPAATIIDARLSYRFAPAGEMLTGGEVFIRVNNLTDEALLLQPGLPGPGRELLVGVKLTL